ncbi:hypothetical protein PhCBS80983_g05153 [Powellomyces hirtus]|uniref:Alpha N-terminal protein methyltransferase 1 n=1 Tax=Powellomyces hirtus TaxID=109895 RepID=A0A507DVQ1_9FUNG|nr:hypothetical protein PhCBS80983_g05153 [Powellomyces hirtus]
MTELDKAMPEIGGPSWYTDAAGYWNGVEPTVQGMLGGFGFLTDIDCKASVEFVNEYVTSGKAKNGSVVAPRIEKGMACDCGAGIGRVSKNFLLKVFDRVDLVEQEAKFLDQAKASFLGEEHAGRVDNFIPKGLQDFEPQEGRYDLIWTQWVLGHLTDDDFVAFFERCKRGLKPNSLIGVKENVTRNGVEVDAEDSSVTRPDSLLKELFAKAGLKIIKEEVQKGFPPSLYPVYMYMLEPVQS